jgi:hypothetical protein
MGTAAPPYGDSQQRTPLQAADNQLKITKATPRYKQMLGRSLDNLSIAYKI